jgi:hypothetical protein
MSALTRRRRGGIDRDTKRMIEDSIRRTTVFPSVDLKRLSDDEQHELAQLFHEASAPGGGTNFRQLSDKQRRAWEDLVEKTAGQPGAFAAERNANDLRTKAAALARRAARAAVPTPKREQAFLGLLGQDLRYGTIDIEDVAALIAVLAALFDGDGLAPGSSVSGGDLLVDRRFGLAPASRDEDGFLARWESSLKWLSEAEYLAVERNGANYSIRVGTKTREALWGSS